VSYPSEKEQGCKATLHAITVETSTYFTYLQERALVRIIDLNKKSKKESFTWNKQLASLSFNIFLAKPEQKLVPLDAMFFLSY